MRWKFQVMFTVLKLRYQYIQWDEDAVDDDDDDDDNLSHTQTKHTFI